MEEVRRTRQWEWKVSTLSNVLGIYEKDTQFLH